VAIRSASPATRDSMPNDYGGTGTINGIDAVERWKRGDSYVKQLIAATIPEPIFNEIKGGTCTKDVWKTLKRNYEER